MLRKNPLYTAVAAALSVTSLPVLAQTCSDDDLAPGVFSSISRNNSLGSTLSTVPCAPTSQESYKDAIGREFKVYTWSSPNKTLSVEMFENRVFTKNARNLAYQSVLVRPDAPSYDQETGVMSVPIMNLVDDAGNATTVYDAQIVMMANGEWALSAYSTEQTGDHKYDPTGYPVSTFNLDSGKLYIPNLKGVDGVKPFAAQLVDGGMWKDLSPEGSAGLIPNYGHDVPAASSPVFDAEQSVLRLPALAIVDENGNRTVVYDAKVLMDKSGGWALLDYKALKEGEAAPYDLSQYDMPLLDYQKGLLVAAGVEGEDGEFGLRAKLNEDGTWTHLSPSDQVPNTSRDVPVAKAPQFNEQSGLLELPALTFVDGNGKRVTVYDAKMVVNADGNWSLLDYKELAEGGLVPYNLSDYVMPLLDVEKGQLVVLGAEKQVGVDEDGSPVFEALDIRANVKDDGTWTPVANLLAPAPAAPVAAAPAYDSQSGVLSMPALSLVDAQGNRQTVYDARVVVDEKGNWAVLDYKTLAADAKAPYDLTGYQMPLLDMMNGKLLVIGAEDTAGGAVDIRADLNPDGSWAPLPDAFAPVPSAPAASAPTFSTTSRVLEMPALSLVDGSGKRTTVYDAKVLLTEEGKWALLDYKEPVAGAQAPYDLTGYTMPLLDEGKGQLVVVGVQNSDGSTQDIRVNLGEDSTWSPVLPAAPAPSVNQDTGVITIPQLAVISASGQRSTIYDAKILLTDSGFWGLLDYQETDQPPFDSGGLDSSLLDYQTGNLMVVGIAEDGGNLLVKLNPDGTWTPLEQ